MIGACPTGCGHQVRPGHLLCRLCWRLVPVPLQREMMRAWRAVMRGPGTAPAEEALRLGMQRMDEYKAAAERATNAARERQIKRELRA